MEINITKLVVYHDEFEIDAEVSQYKGKDVRLEEKYILRFNNLVWKPHKIITEIARWMMENKGEDRKYKGIHLKDNLGFKTEKEFQDIIYYYFNYSITDEGRISKKGLFRLYRIYKNRLIEEDDISFRIKFAQALIQNNGGKTSEKSAYWLGNYKDIKIVFDKDTDYNIPVKITKSMPEEYCLYGRSLLIKGLNTFNEFYLHEACKYFELSINKRTDFSEAYNHFGEALFQIALIKNKEKYFLKALNKFCLAIKFKRKYPEAHYNIGLMLFQIAVKRSNQYLHEKSIKHSKLAIKYNAGYSRAYYNWGLNLDRLGLLEKNNIARFKEACKKYKLAIKYENNFTDAYTNLGIDELKIFEKTDKKRHLDNSIKNFKIAVELDNEAPDKYYNLAIALIKKYEITAEDNLNGRISDSLFISFLLAINKKNWVFANHIAVSYILKAVEDKDDNPIYKNTLIFYEAIEVIEQSRHPSKKLLNDLKNIQDNNDKLLSHTAKYVIENMKE